MGVITSRGLFVSLILAVGILRLAELRMSRRRIQRLRGEGAARIPEPHFGAMVTLHVAVLAGALVEVWWASRPFIPLLGLPALGCVLAASGLRWWVIGTMGAHWNVQIMDSSHRGVVASGPFRFVRHPNYVAVFVELLALPLVHTAWITALVGSAAHLWVLAHRIRVEERMLLGNPEYQRLMGNKPRFLPRRQSSDLGA